MKTRDYLVTTEKNGRARKIIWHSHSSLALDFPERWFLEKSDAGFQLRHREGAPGKVKEKICPVSADFMERGGRIRLTNKIEGRADEILQVQLKPLNALRPIYLTRPEKISSKAQLFLYHGTRYYLIGFEPVNGDYAATVNTKKVFDLKKKPNGFYEITSHVQGLKFKNDLQNQKLSFHVGQSHTLTEEQLTFGGISWAKHWWRMNRVATPEPLISNVLEERKRKEEKGFRRFMGAASILFVLLCAWMAFNPPKKSLEERIVEQTTVSLKKPKIIELQKPKKESPKIVAQKKPAPPPKKAEAKPQPKPPAVKPPAVKPPPVVAKAPPPKPAPDPAVLAARAKAQATAQLAKSLDFLSPVGKKAAVRIDPDKTAEKYQAVPGSNLKVSSDKTVLTQVASAQSHDAIVDLRSAQSVQGVAAVGDSKRLNEVQGRVSLASLYDPNSKGDLGSALNARGMSVTGTGELASGEVEKTLSKYLNRFQYCYEKALLTNSGLSGLLMMEWTIQLGGQAQQAKVIRSQMNDAKLHQCMVTEIEKIDFPTPKGGEVIIRYPFNFSSSTL